MEAKKKQAGKEIIQGMKIKTEAIKHKLWEFR